MQLAEEEGVGCRVGKVWNPVCLGAPDGWRLPPPPPPPPPPRVSVSGGAITQELRLRFRSSRPKLGLNSRAQLPRQQQQQHFFHLLLISASKRLHGDRFPLPPSSERISVVDMEYLWLQSS